MDAVCLTLQPGPQNLRHIGTSPRHPKIDKRARLAAFPLCGLRHPRDNSDPRTPVTGGFSLSDESWHDRNEDVIALRVGGTIRRRGVECAVAGLRDRQASLCDDTLSCRYSSSFMVSSIIRVQYCVQTFRSIDPPTPNLQASEVHKAAVGSVCASGDYYRSESTFSISKLDRNSFVRAGAKKCGTNSLNAILKNHPYARYLGQSNRGKRLIREAGGRPFGESWYFDCALYPEHWVKRLYNCTDNGPSENTAVYSQVCAPV